MFTCSAPEFCWLRTLNVLKDHILLQYNYNITAIITGLCRLFIMTVAADNRQLVSRLVRR